MGRQLTALMSGEGSTEGSDTDCDSVVCNNWANHYVVVVVSFSTYLVLLEEWKAVRPDVFSVAARQQVKDTAVAVTNRE